MQCHKGHIPQSWNQFGSCFLKAGLSGRSKLCHFLTSVEFTDRQDTGAEAKAKENVVQYRGLYMVSV